MTYRVRFTQEAEADLVRLYEFILDRDAADWALAERALRVSGHEEQTDASWTKDGVTWRTKYSEADDPARWCVQMWSEHHTPGPDGG